jgi:hypothetical protein
MWRWRVGQVTLQDGRLLYFSTGVHNGSAINHDDARESFATCGQAFLF